MHLAVYPVQYGEEAAMQGSKRLASAILALLLGCGGATEEAEPQAAPAVAPAVAIGGQYEVTGVTIGLADGSQRPIQGLVTLVAEADGYKAHFELSTRFPGMEAVAASVVGAGGGTIAGNVLEGTADTQLLVASVPGVDVGFAYVPREVGPRIVSSSRAEFFADGSVRIEIENRPKEGEDYAPTRTQLVGYRRGDEAG
jgi:hypothetical protein